MKGTGRPPTRAAKLADGFYIEVRNRGSQDKGIKIRSATRLAMENAAKGYAKNKDVTILGEYRDEAWVG